MNKGFLVLLLLVELLLSEIQLIYDIFSLFFFDDILCFDFLIGFFISFIPNPVFFIYLNNIYTIIY